MEIYSYESTMEDLEKELMFAIKIGDWDLAHKIVDRINHTKTKFSSEMYLKYSKNEEG